MGLIKQAKRPLKGALLCWGVFLWSGSGAQAQLVSASPGQAQVYAVAGAGKAAPFRVPQVRLPSAAVAGRINRELRRRLLAAHTSQVDSTAALSRQLQQASRECCYDETLRQWTNWHGLTGCDYQVLFNQGGLLSLAYFEEFTGAYTWESTRHVTFDLRTGRVLALTDLLADDPAQLRRRMQGAINRRLTEALHNTAPYDSAYVAERFREDRAERTTNFTADREGKDAIDLTDFALTPQQLVVFHEIYFAHVMQNIAPDDAYRFPYQRLHPRPLLQQALGAPVAGKKKTTK